VTTVLWTRYLDWIQTEDTEELQYQTPEDWLKKLCNDQFSDVLSIANVRFALSFKEVDYLWLAADGDSMYVINADPGALRLGPSTSSSFGGSEGLNIHPALISLTLLDVDESNLIHQRISRLVLHVGRVLSGRPNTLLDDVLDGVLQGQPQVSRPVSACETFSTPNKYFAELFHDVPALIEYLELLPPGMSEQTASPDLKSFNQTDCDSSGEFASQPLKEYTRGIIKILASSAKIPQRSGETWERKRRELWHDIMRTTTTFN
jgi:hypothetical protein